MTYIIFTTKTKDIFFFFSFSFCRTEAAVVSSPRKRAGGGRV